MPLLFTYNNNLITYTLFNQSYDILTLCIIEVLASVYMGRLFFARSCSTATCCVMEFFRHPSLGLHNQVFEHDTNIWWKMSLEHYDSAALGAQNNYPLLRPTKQAHGGLRRRGYHLFAKSHFRSDFCPSDQKKIQPFFLLLPTFTCRVEREREREGIEETKYFSQKSINLLVPRAGTTLVFFYMTVGNLI